VPPWEGLSDDDPQPARTAQASRIPIAAVADLPDDAALQRWMAERDFIPYIRRSAREHLESALRQLEIALTKSRSGWPRSTFDELRRLGEEIANAYD